MNTDFITGVNSAHVVAVNRTHIYFVPAGGSVIGRARIDGGGVITNFITGVPFTNGLALTSTHVYWTSNDKIGRARLDGSEVNPDFYTTGVVDPGRIAIADNYIYWVQGANKIAVVRTNGVGFSPDAYPGIANAWSVHVNGSHVYWGKSAGSGIGRVAVNGAGFDSSFITPTGLVGGVDGDARYLYWADNNFGAVGRARLNGTGLESDFITSMGSAVDVAVDWIRHDGAAFTIGKLSGKRLTIDNPGPGRLVLTGKGLKKQTVNTTGPNTRMKLAYKPALKKKLKRLGKGKKAKVQVKVVFRPSLGSGSATRTKSLKVGR